MKIRFYFNYRIFVRLQIVAVGVILISAAVGYLIAHLSGNMNSFVLRLVDVSAESSIPTYFSALNLLLSFLLLLVFYFAERKQKKQLSRYWFILALIFLYLSVDEGAQIHERFSSLGRHLLNYFDIQLYWLHPTRYWLMFGIPLALIVGVFYIPFVLALPDRTRNYFIAAAVLYITGAFGFELAGDLLTQLGYSKLDPINQLRRLLEEGFEMSAIAFFNCTLLSEIIHREVDIEICSAY